VDGAEFPAIRTVALIVFSTVTSSAALEREFSTMGFVHSKMSNRLGRGKGKQLVFIKTNAPQLLSDQTGAEWEEPEESDGDEERWPSLE
jgi:hypothetical protein